MLDSAENQLDTAIEKDDMVGIRVARELITNAKGQLKNAVLHRSEHLRLRDEIGSKRKSAFVKLMEGVKKKH